ncbi:MAG: hypothetical protein WBO34_15180 [Gammaproteobacteria bacterium]
MKTGADRSAPEIVWAFYLKRCQKGDLFMRYFVTFPGGGKLIRRTRISKLPNLASVVQPSLAGHALNAHLQGLIPPGYACIRCYSDSG